MTPRLAAPPPVPRWALSQAPHLDHCREIWEQGRQLALVPGWSRAVLREQGMLVPLVAHCRRDMTPLMHNA